MTHQLPRYDLVIANGEVLDPAAGITGRLDVGIAGGANNADRDFAAVGDQNLGDLSGFNCHG